MSQFAELECCADVLERLDAWIDGDLDETCSAAVKAHIDQCESCRAEQQLAELVLAELRSMPEFDIPERVVQTVQEKTRPAHGNAPDFFFQLIKIRPAPALAAAAAFVVMVLVLAPWRKPPEPQFTDQEIAQAVADTKLALAYVGSIAQRAELRVKERVLEEGAAAQTVSGVRRSLRVIGEAGAAVVDLHATPRTQVKGS